MGGGSWTTSAFTSYATSKGRTIVNACSADGLSYSALSSNYSTQDIYKARTIDPALNPYNVMRECVDTEEHPNTIPVIFGLDVTGSMGSSLEKVAKQIDLIMNKLYKEITDVEFMIMGIGDLYCDTYPIQISQFESDIRIAEQLEKVYFERGGGGNRWESYTAAWYMGSRHCKLDCWKRNKKGIIITLGDESINPYLEKNALARVTGDNLQADIETKELYKEASEKFDIYHVVVTDGGSSYGWHELDIKTSWPKYLDSEHLKYVTIDNLAEIVSTIIIDASSSSSTNTISEISW